jgi:topoisomerase-4 subunit B
VNGQNTTQGGTHLAAYREAVVKTVRDFYKKEYDPADVRASMVAAISIRVQEPVFESQTKTKLGSLHLTPNGGTTIRSFVNDFIKTELDKFLHMNPDVRDALQKRILQSEKERKDISGIRKLANEKAKKANLHNKKLRDCRIHLTDLKDIRREDTTLFITEGDSASGSITKSRDVNTQAVFSLRGKPLNVYGLTKKVVYENEEFNLVQAALDIEDDLDETIFITKYCVTVRLRNALYEYYFNHNLLNEDKTMLIENLKYVDKKQFNELRNIGKKTFTELEDFAEYNNIKLL